MHFHIHFVYGKMVIKWRKFYKKLCDGAHCWFQGRDFFSVQCVFPNVESSSFPMRNNNKIDDNKQRINDGVSCQ